MLVSHQAFPLTLYNRIALMSQVQATEMEFLPSPQCATLRRSFCSALNVELLLRIESSQLRWFGHVSRIPHKRLARQVLLAKPMGTRSKGRRTTRWSDCNSELLGPSWCGITRITWNCCFPSPPTAGFTRNFSSARKQSECGKCSVCPCTLHSREAYYSWMTIADAQATSSRRSSAAWAVADFQQGRLR